MMTLEKSRASEIALWKLFWKNKTDNRTSR